MINEQKDDRHSVKPLLQQTPVSSSAFKVLVACEYSGVVRDAFRQRGFDAMSCDLLPTESPGKHYQGNVLDIINDGWDLMIAHPPCTYLTVSANRVYLNNPERWKKRLEALEFVYQLMNAPIEYIAIENPIGAISSHIRKPEQIIQPFYFGDNVPKSTCLWLKNLPPLEYALNDNLFMSKTKVEPEYIIYNSSTKKSGKSKYSIFGKMGGGSGKIRSKFFPGIAQAMASQWGDYLLRAVKPHCC